jgi:hypothetical protein
MEYTGSQLISPEQMVTVGLDASMTNGIGAK